MGAMKTYLILLFSMSVMLYLAGYTSPFLALEDKLGSNTNLLDTLLTDMINIFTNPAFLTAIGIGAVASLLVGSGNYSVIYLVPVVMLSVFMNYFILPLSFIYDVTLPGLIKTLFVVFMNLFLFLAVIEFIRGG